MCVNLWAFNIKCQAPINIEVQREETRCVLVKPDVYSENHITMEFQNMLTISRELHLARKKHSYPKLFVMSFIVYLLFH